MTQEMHREQDRWRFTLVGDIQCRTTPNVASHTLGISSLQSRELQKRCQRSSMISILLVSGGVSYQPLSSGQQNQMDLLLPSDLRISLLALGKSGYGHVHSG